METNSHKLNTVKIKINGKEYTTVIDKYGTQSFCINSLIRHLVDSKQVDLNRLSEDCEKGKFTRQERQEFYIGMGYSLCGFDEVFGINSGLDQKNQAIIENPLWDSEFTEHLT